MTAAKRDLLRLAGIIALICAAVVFAADVIMLGLPVSGAASPGFRNLLEIAE